MAADHQTLMPQGLMRARSKPNRHLVQLGASSLLALSLLGCTRNPDPQPEQFVGTWQSSRLNSRPAYLLANGDWEIRAQGGGKPLQYGVWQIQGRTMVWTFRTGGQTIHDKNRIESFSAGQFVLREQDGSLTSFKRLD